MKRIRRRYPDSESLDLFDTIGRKAGYRIGDAADGEQFAAEVRTALGRARSNPIILHGRRVEAMFGFVAASLKNCHLISQEDSGEVYAVDDTLRIPDYQIVLRSGEKFFVEVKNCNDANAERTLYFARDYINGLEKYAALFGTSVKVAIYWSRWRLWTLISTERLPHQGEDLGLTLLKALKINEMALLGDSSIATVPPLRMRVLTDPTKPRRVTPDSEGHSHVEFTIGGIDFYSAEKRIEDAKEKSIAFYLMLHGRWTEQEPITHIQNGELVAVDFVKVPKELEPGQSFAIVGSLSSMISDAYADVTTDDAGIQRLAPPLEPGSLGILIDPSYKGMHLPLWRFHVKPNYND